MPLPSRRLPRLITGVLPTLAAPYMVQTLTAVHREGETRTNKTKKKGKFECRRVKLVVLRRRRRPVSLNSLTMAVANSVPEWMTTRFCTKAATAEKKANATRYV